MCDTLHNRSLKKTYQAWNGKYQILHLLTDVKNMKRWAVVKWKIMWCSNFLNWSNFDCAISKKILKREFMLAMRAIFIKYQFYSRPRKGEFLQKSSANEDKWSRTIKAFKKKIEEKRTKRKTVTVVLLLKNKQWKTHTSAEHKY